MNIIMFVDAVNGEMTAVQLQFTAKHIACNVIC